MEPQLLHVSDAELVRNVRSILQRVETGAEVIIERNAQPIAVLRSVTPSHQKLSECIAMPEDSTVTIDADFAADVDAAVAAHREPLESPVWD